MTDQVSNLRKENEDLKKQLSEIQKDLKSIKKGVSKEKKHGGAEKKREAWPTMQTPLVIAQPQSKPNENDVQFISDQCEDLVKRLTDLELRVEAIAKNAERIGKAIDDIQTYSYQYNLKIVGVPQKENEKAADTVDLCLKVFSGIGADVSKWDIDTAHRVPPRNYQNGRRKQFSQSDTSYPIICKFTRRIARESVLSRRRETSQLQAFEFDLEHGKEMRISIFSHLTPRLQELLHSAKQFQEEAGYKYCWAKDTAIFMRKTESSKVLRLNTAEELEELRHEYS